MASLSLYIFTLWKCIVYNRFCRDGIYFDKILVSEHRQPEPLNRNESGRFGALKSDSTHHFFRNACTMSGSLRFSHFSGCWLIFSVYIIMSFDFPFVRLFGVRYEKTTELFVNYLNMNYFNIIVSQISLYLYYIYILLHKKLGLMKLVVTNKGDNKITELRTI
jgi:hypothetical protein